jgi:hypothetical protein
MFIETKQQQKVLHEANSNHHGGAGQSGKENECQEAQDPNSNLHGHRPGWPGTCERGRPPEISILAMGE